MAAAAMWAMRQWPRTGIAAQVEESTWLVVGRKNAQEARMADVIVADFTGQAVQELAAVVEAGTVRTEPHPSPGGAVFYAALEPLPAHAPPARRQRKLKVAR